MAGAHGRTPTATAKRGFRTNDVARPTNKPADGAGAGRWYVGGGPAGHPDHTGVVERRGLPAAALAPLDRRSDQRLERRLVQLVALAQVDGVAGAALQADVEQARGVRERGTLGERRLTVLL
jgi:hypothetical protein